MTRDERVALFFQGKEAWNAWAGDMLAKRKSMEKDGRWAAEKDVLGSLEPKNDETRAWMEAARVDFSRCLFLVRGAEGTKEAAGKAEKEEAAGAQLVKSIAADSTNIDFSGFIVPGPANFESATFARDANFRSAIFTGRADFQSATFTGPANFQSATFTGPANFRSATFTGDAWFQSATFTRNGFFSEAQFKGSASFYALRGDRGFDMADAVFETAPDFIQAHFEEAPRLDNVRVVGRMIAQHPQPEREETESRWLKRWNGGALCGRSAAELARPRRKGGLAAHAPCGCEYSLALACAEAACDPGPRHRPGA
jgi:Pentapeptide repeats (9 copies)